MKLTLGQIHDVVMGLSSLEDSGINLSGLVILHMAINLSNLRGLATAYEQSRSKSLAKMVSNKKDQSNQEVEHDFLEEDQKMRAKVEEVNVKTINVKDLKLDENPKIRPVTVARLMPILTGV